MRQFECGTIIPGCDAVFQGETDDEVMSQVPAHAREAHGLAEIPHSIAARARSLIHDV